MGKSHPRSLTKITPLKFLVALDQVTRDARAADDAREAEPDVDEEAETRPYGLPRGMMPRTE